MIRSATKPEKGPLPIHHDERHVANLRIEFYCEPDQDRQSSRCENRRFNCPRSKRAHRCCGWTTCTWPIQRPSRTGPSMPNVARPRYCSLAATRGTKACFHRSIFPSAAPGTARVWKTSSKGWSSSSTSTHDPGGRTQSRTGARRGAKPKRVRLYATHRRSPPRCCADRVTPSQRQPIHRPRIGACFVRGRYNQLPPPGHHRIVVRSTTLHRN